MNLRTTVLIIAGLLVSSPAHAQTWFALDRAASSAWYADSTSVQLKDGVTSATFLQSFVSPEQPSAYHIKAAIELRCASDEYRLMQMWTYDLPVRETGSDRGPTPWQPVQPWTLIEDVRDFACRREGGEPVANPFADAQIWRDAILQAQ